MASTIRRVEMQKQSGFTLIELIMVIVILGILAATALPKFVDMGGDARRAALAGVEGSMRSAASLAHAASLAAGSSVVTIEGTAYTMTNGYPAVADINTLTGVTGGNYNVTTAGTIQDDGAATPASCKVVYSAAPANGTPTITKTDSGC